jgi:hypothetical protein
MTPTVRAAFVRNGGLITNRQAQAAGLSPDQIRALIRQGVWLVVRRGVYAEQELWASLDEWRGRPFLRARAAHLTMIEEHAMSHETGALWLDLDYLRPSDEIVHITRPDVLGSRTAYGVKHHGAVFRDEQVLEVDGVRVLDLARTAIDIGREHGYRAGLVACDAARRKGVRLTELRAAHEPMNCWPNIRGARAAVEDSDPGAQSVGETLGRELVRELGIGLPVETQVPILLPGGRVVWVDMLVGRHVFEFDGRIKYMGREDGGVADRPAAEIIWEEKKRERLISAEELGVSRIIWDDFWLPARAAARNRLRSEYDVTERRFGTELPGHLRRFIAEHRNGRRPSA